MHIKFYERNNKTYVRVAGNGLCYRICTRAVLTTAKQRVVKKQIQELFPDRRAIDRLFIAPEPAPDSTDLVALAYKYYELAKAGVITKKSGKALSKKSLQLVDYVYKLHAQYNKPFDLKQHALVGTIEEKKAVRDSFMKHMMGFQNFLRRYSNSSKSTIVNVTNTIIKYWAEELFIEIPKLRYVYVEQNPIVVLPDEVVSEFLADKDLTGDIKMTWEVCATMLVTTLRIGDATALTDKHITDGHLSKYNQKTGATSNTPLPKFLLDIYRSNLEQFGRIYVTHPNHTTIYANMKELFKRYPSAHKEMSFQIDGVMVTKPVYEWVKPHMLRKTGITRMISAGVPDRDIKILSGHTPSSKSFELYVAFNERKHQESIKKYHAQF